MVDAAQFLEQLRKRMPPGVEPGSKEQRLQRMAERENRRHGNLDKLDGYHCAKCSNKGFSVYVKGEEIVQVTCSCDKARRSIANLKRSGLEAVVKKYTLGGFEAKQEWQKEMLGKAREFLEAVRKGDNYWFFVSGNTGCGKTHICSAVAVQLLRECKEVRYMLWRDESRKIKAAATERDNPIEIYKSAEVLYIDDLFKIGRTAKGELPFPSGADITLVYELLNYRIVKGLTTIISSEFSIEDIFEMDAATAGRIKEASGPFLINVGNDMRKNYRLYGGEAPL